MAGRRNSESPLIPEAWPLVVTPRSGAEADGSRNEISGTESKATARIGVD